MKKKVKAVILLLFVLIPLVNAEQIKALAAGYSDLAQEIIDKYGIPTENVQGYKLNEDFLIKQGIVVYGRPADVPGNSYKGSIPRYSGYDYDGNKYSTYNFPMDDDCTGHIGKQWIKYPWDTDVGKNKGIKRPAYLDEPYLRQMAIDELNKMLDYYDSNNRKVPPTGKTWLESFNSITGNNWTAETLLDYAVINNFHSEFGQGNITMWSIQCGGGSVSNPGHWWYSVFMTPPDKFIDIPGGGSCKNDCGPTNTKGLTYTDPYDKWVCTSYDEFGTCTGGYWVPKDYFEYLSSNVSTDKSSVKAGNGFSIQVNTSYSNEWYSPAEVNGPTSVTVYFETADSYLPKSVELIPQNGSGAWENTWVLPEVFVEKYSGNMFYNTSDPNRDTSDELISGGRKWYTPFKYKDGSFSFRVEVKGAGTTGLNDCVSECVIVNGSPFDDYIIRSINPSNPFPAGTGFNWSGFRSIIDSVTGWFYEKLH